MPNVSIIIPTYNCGRYLDESLQSIFEQTYRDFDVVVVDDGSTDDTDAVLARHAGRVRAIKGDHGGLSAARNLGLAHASGRWVAFHDADDVALPDRLAFQLDFLAAHPAFDAVFCNGERMEVQDGASARVVPAAFARGASGPPLGVEDLFVGYPVYFQGALVPRRAFDEAGPFDSGFPVQPDIEYGYRLLPRCRAAFVDRVVFRYRWHTTNNSGNRLGGREDIARILERLLRDDAPAARAIGVRRIRARIARHWYRVACRRLELGDTMRGREALERAVALRPLHPRYRLLSLRQAL